MGIFAKETQLLSKFEMKLRAAGLAQILPYESGFLNRIASEADQFIKSESLGPGVADARPYHLCGCSPGQCIERVSFPPPLHQLDEGEGR